MPQVEEGSVDWAAEDSEVACFLFHLLPKISDSAFDRTPHESPNGIARVANFHFQSFVRAIIFTSAPSF